MSFWELQACVLGFNRANGSDQAAKPKAPTSEQHRENLRLLH